MAKKTLRSLAITMIRVNKNITRVKNAHVKAAAKEALRLVVARTPVDTTLAVSNWQVSFNTPTGPDVIPAHFWGRRGITSPASRGKTKQIGFKKIAEYQKGFIRISNKVHYIGLLNTGHSDQDPGAFVEAARVKVRVILKQLKVPLTFDGLADVN